MKNVKLGCGNYTFQICFRTRVDKCVYLASRAYRFLKKEYLYSLSPKTFFGGLNVE